METFKEIINGDMLVVVDYFATWCGPCKVMEPVVEELSKELEGKARVLKIDVDKNQDTVDKFNVFAVPTIILYQNGKELWRHAGTMPKPDLLSNIERFML